MGKFATVIEKICNVIDWLSVISGYIAATIGWILVALIFFGVLFRYFFNTPIEFRDELACYLYIANALLALAYATYLESHVAAEMLYTHFPPKVQYAVTLISYLAVIICIGFIVWYGTSMTYTYLIRGWRSDTQHAVLLWPVVAIIPLAFLLFGLECLSRIRVLTIRLRQTGSIKVEETFALD